MNVICFGDSNTWGFDPRSFLGDRYPEEYRWPEILAKKTGWIVRNMGINGQEIPQTPIAFPVNTDLLIVMLGTNDLLHGSNAETAATRMGDFITGSCRNIKRIVLIAPPAMQRGEWVESDDLVQESSLLHKYYRGIAESIGIDYIDTSLSNIPLAYDGVHFTNEGHTIFAQIIVDYLTSINVN